MDLLKHVAKLAVIGAQEHHDRTGVHLDPEAYASEALIEEMDSLEDDLPDVARWRAEQRRRSSFRPIRPRNGVKVDTATGPPLPTDEQYRAELARKEAEAAEAKRDPTIGTY